MKMQEVKLLKLNKSCLNLFDKLFLYVLFLSQ